MILLVLIAVVAVCTVRAQEGSDEEKLLTNLDVVRNLAGNIAGRVLRDADLRDVTEIEISVLPKESSWYIEGSILENLKNSSINPSVSEAAPLLFEFGLSDVSVEYSGVRRDWLFGARMVDRTVRLRLAARIVDRRSGSIVLTDEFADSKTDTIGLSEIRFVENPTIPITKGKLPQQGFFSNVAEPLVVIGSIAVAVLLLFNVRS
ncbi:MAG: hypothetical protein KF749_13750 [Bacteroidetes bacterium]|nr:hypothetical protein [Bacteroidota bacterium]MCW5896282.1 hypothetical protein [Bacteroidota bacterium]